MGTYAKIHNKVLRRYRRSCMYIFWGVCFSLFALVLFFPETDLVLFKATFEADALEYDKVGLGYGLIINTVSLPGNLLFTFVKDMDVGVYMTAFDCVFTIIFAALLFTCAFFARKGNVIALYVGLAFYLFDFVLFPFNFFPQLAPFMTLTMVEIILNVCFHIGITVMIILAVVFRFQLVKLKEEKDSLSSAQPEENTETPAVKVISFKKNASKKEGVAFLDLDNENKVEEIETKENTEVEVIPTEEVENKEQKVEEKVDE